MEYADDLADFQGQARLFPLPNLVLFPGMVQGLHIFEPRYREMTADALAGDRRIAMALLRPGWEPDYLGRPALFPVACLGKIVADHQLADGRFNLQLRGLSRIRIVEELSDGLSYRTARVELLTEHGRPDAEREAGYRRHFLERVPDWCQPTGPVQEAFAKLLRSKLPFGMLCDILSFSLALPIEFKQAMLEFLDIGERARLLLEYLTAHRPATAAALGRVFPPEFSTN